ncbi:hypothetical protein [Pseudomonas helleri]|uniref:hypothetical protein n=1 Tax=Pseudomonas helleri TaxID=1608996 RepID=UPI000653578A|nr:hypothetical protein [Pseudomonas helleri]KMN09053.1 hypothetical protein TU84_13060 [Pseudomonas helleri]
MAINIIISEPDTKRLFDRSITGYRAANVALDAAIDGENWSAINLAQSNRELHANTIALIVNMYADTTAGQGAQS